MATTFIKYDTQTDLGRRITRGLQEIREGRQILRDVLLMEPTQIDGDSSDASQFTLMASQGGFASNAAAKASWDELNSLVAKLNMPGGSGDSTGAAIDQACAKHGV